MSDSELTGAMLEALYQELRALARAKLKRERPGQTLRTTELVHEAFLRLQSAKSGAWQGRGHFFAAAAEAMRRILIERARARGRMKRGGDESGRAPQRLLLEDLTAADLAVGYDIEEILALDDALERLGRSDRRAADVVRLRFYGGFNTQETAEALGVTDRTVRRDWTFARAWLFDALR
ncbi:MAG: ECF-type sigma factor [Candidatus Eiseniibacteriota bacterium]